MLALHYQPERLVWPGLEEYPAHLHIDLLPPFQGAGHGRALMETFYAAAAQAGAARGARHRDHGQHQGPRLLPPPGVPPAGDRPA